MPRYVVERTFEDGLSDGAPPPAVSASRNADEGVTWIHSYVSDDGRQTYCVLDGPSPEAIRKAAAHNGFPSTGSPRFASSTHTSASEVLRESVEQRGRPA